MMESQSHIATAPSYHNNPGGCSLHPCTLPTITGKDILNRASYFMSDKEWELARNSKSFDYIIIGSSFCALAFVDRILQNNPMAKCIILERGDYFHPDHIEQLPLVDINAKEVAQSFPWSLTEKTCSSGQWVHGMYSFFGGRSSFWSGWCPEPTDDEMEGWPIEVIETVHEYFPAATRLLNITPANEIFSKQEHTKSIFGILQDTMDKRLADTQYKVEKVTRVCPAPLAVVADPYRYKGYRKLSVHEKLLSLARWSKADRSTCGSLKIKIECLVTRINHDGLMATELETTRGKFALGRAKVILAMGTLPPTTLVLNSFPVNEFPLLKNVGKRFTGHIKSLIVARLPKVHLCSNAEKVGNHEMAANYIAGKNTNTISCHQFHIQLSSVPGHHDTTKWSNTLLYKSRCIVACPSIDQLSTSTDHIVLLCSCIGQLDHHNSENWLQKNDGKDPTTNVDLQVVLNNIDEDLWDTMDSTTFEILEKVFGCDDIEYWHNRSRLEDGEEPSRWKKTRPPKAQIRHHGIVHETSTMWIGNDHEAPVGLDYRLKGVENVFVTGGSLWPTGASWNPTGVMSALAIHLADQVCTVCARTTTSSTLM